MSKPLIGVSLADDHAIFRRGLRELLEDSGRVRVTAEFATGRAVLNAAAAQLGEVLVLDLSLPGVPGAEVLTRVRAAHPAVRVVVLSMYAEALYGARMVRGGARIYLAKTEPPESVVAAIIAVGEGREGDAAPAPARAAQLPHERLSAREHQVFSLLAEGHSVGEIAVELNLSASTVSNHLAKVREKLGAKSNVEVLKYALSAGLVAE